MTPEERVQQIIGQQAMTIALLQSELEKVRAELTELKKNAPAKQTNGGVRPGDYPIDHPVKGDLGSIPE